MGRESRANKSAEFAKAHGWKKPERPKRTATLRLPTTGPISNAAVDPSAQVLIQSLLRQMERRKSGF